jgi:hypothetical protein
MATATRKNNVPPSPPSPEGQGAIKPGAPFLIRAFDSTFRFLASVKLAVICLASLATALAFGTRFNSLYGMAAANEYIYQAKWFSILLAFLAINIFCAALIRFPWTKRQTGFVITHIGLLTVISGSYWASQTSDEGQLGLKEGETSSELVRLDKPAFFIRSIDPHTGQPQSKYELPFYPGTFDWPEGRFEVVSKPEDPFKLAVKKYFAASIPKTIYVSDPAGSPMARIRPKVKPPRAETFIDALSEDEQWFNPPVRGVPRIVREIPRAQVRFTFNENHDIFDDFLEPPAEPGLLGIARLRYQDKGGKDRFLDVRIDDAKPAVALPLPDSDLIATFTKTESVNLGDPAFRQMTGEDELKIVEFNIKKGAGPEVAHRGYASLPMIPPIIPDRNDKEATPPTPLIQISYYLPPVVDPQINGRFDVIEVMGDDHGRLAYRIYVRGNGANPGKLGPHGLLKEGQEINATPGSDPSAMNLSFSVDQFLQTGLEKQIDETVDLPISMKDEGLAAVLAEMTVNGVTKEVWLRRSPTFEQIFVPLTFPDGMYEIAFDVDRLNLGFSLTLDDFDVGFDPGTSTASSYRSEVRLTDEAEHIKDKPVSIFMNNTLDHRGWRFFQTSYRKDFDLKTGRPTGKFVSVFQVAKNPAREMIYFGCIIVVLGAFVQFYMRAGIFTDGGKLEQHKAADKARKRLEAKAGKPSPPTIQPGPEDDIETL